ncbi:MAG: DUF3887 domain-containing protein [Oscillibacter sp.]|nr:DUF3887 domain-containing protein [Oscillibacter sp.]
MRQKALRLAAALLVLVLLTGCQGKALPAGMEEAELLKHGREAVVLLAGGDYEEVYDLMREDVAAGTSVEDIQNLVIQQTDGAGVYKQINSSMVTGQSSSGENYGIAVFYCDYSKKNVLFRLAFDTNYELIGMEIKKQ